VSERSRVPRAETLQAARHAARGGWAGKLPERYRSESYVGFRDRIEASLRAGVAILDAGSGANPCLPPAERPRGCRYVGLDLSRSELLRAPKGSYDEIVVGDLRRRMAELELRFDLVVSWFALEHVKPLAAAVRNLLCYLKPGGRLVAVLAGAFSPASVLNRLIPLRLARPMLARLFDRDPGSVFPAHYDRCWHSALVDLLEEDGWDSAEVVPLYLGARYLESWSPLLAAYLAYEEWALLTGRSNLAPYYLVDAVRSYADGGD
jgi:SAM-dependent methyltransferase